MRLYTRTGDDGTTGLYRQARRPKGDPIFDALGDIDELSAVLGCCKGNWRRVQGHLLDIGGFLAGAEGAVDEQAITDMEGQIDSLQAIHREQRGELRTFILPVGMTNVARAVCRRAERSVARLEAVPRPVLVYLNRLSDLLFAVALAEGDYEERKVDTAADALLSGDVG